MSNTTRILEQALKLSKKIDQVNSAINVDSLTVSIGKFPRAERRIAENKIELDKLSKEMNSLLHSVVS